MTNSEQQIRFEDGAGYERMMGAWSRLAGTIFLDWLAPAPSLRWIDVGCGTGAFTGLIVERCAPAEVQGIDPAAAQLAFARTRHKDAVAQFREGTADALPFANHGFDAAVMALVLFFVPDPAKAVAEMVRVVRPRGLVAAYVWDVLGGGFPQEPVWAEMRALGASTMRPPTSEASRMEALQQLWTGAGLAAVQTREISVQRTFADFDEFWSITLLSPSVGPAVAAMPSDQIELLKSRVRARLSAESAGTITCAGRANAIKGQVPA
jgi:ubiquinone/menaquinone biosynthesis C-methylase UbiE